SRTRDNGGRSAADRRSSGNQASSGAAGSAQQTARGAAPKPAPPRKPGKPGKPNKTGAFKDKKTKGESASPPTESSNSRAPGRQGQRPSKQEPAAVSLPAVDTFTREENTAWYRSLNLKPLGPDLSDKFKDLHSLQIHLCRLQSAALDHVLRNP